MGKLKTFCFLWAAYVFVPSNYAVAQALPATEIVENLSGLWAIPFERDSVQVVDCSELTNYVEVVTKEGELYLKQQHSGSQLEELYETPIARISLSDESDLVPHITIRYLEENSEVQHERPDYWRLFMFGSDKFAWQSSEWSGAQITGVRERCKTIEVS